MKKSFKQIFTDYLNSLCDELRASIEHNKCKPRTPKLNKLGKLAIIFCCVIYLLIGCFSGINASAEEEPEVLVTNLIGYTISVPSNWTIGEAYGLFSLTGSITSYYGNYDLASVEPNFGIGYSNDGMFNSMNNYVSAVVVSHSAGSISLPSGEGFTLTVTGGDDVTNDKLITWFYDVGATFTRFAPTDLTGYTVTVPSNWSAPSDYGQFGISFSPAFSLNGVEYYGLAIGYETYVDPIEGEPGHPSYASNSLCCASSSGFYLSDYRSSSSLIFEFFASDTFDYTDPDLIRWLVSNNATFSNGSVDPDPPDPSSYTVSAGFYFLQHRYNDLRGTIDFSTPFISVSTYFNSIEFVGTDNEQYVSITYVDVNDNFTKVYAENYWVNGYEYSVIFLQSDVVLDATEYDLFTSAFASFTDNPDFDVIFKAGQENGQSFGYSQGYDAGLDEGYDIGYSDGFTDGVNSDLEDSFMGDFFGGIVEALDALKLFGDVSMLNIIEGILGLMLALWILKLIAGG